MASDDDQIAELLTELADRLHRGEDPHVEAVFKQHPQWAKELRRLWAAVMIAEEMANGTGRAADDPANTDQPFEPTSPHSPSPKGQAANLLDAGLTNSGVLLPREFGDYELQEEIGRGGMGVVYKARQESLNRIVALKMILRGELASSSDVARFRQEAESAAQLEHVGIVPVYEVGEREGQPYFTMKLIAGTTLAHKLADGPMAANDSARLLAKVSRAVDYAHQHGVLHRDLKPSNILIGHDGQPHVSDFGLAKRIEGGASLTRSGAILGTPSHMAPEQAAGGLGEIGPFSDVYSLGTILYQMLTGQPPFQAATPVDTILLVLEQDPLPPRLLNARADRELEMIALRCLQKLPSLRYQTAGELADDLEAYLAGEPIAARSGKFSQIIARLFRETHHAAVLENWGLLWMLHAAALLVICLVTNGLKLTGVDSVWPYLSLWTLGLGTWAAIFWALRRRAGPVTFVERQIAHIWAGSMAVIPLLFVIERLLGLDVLELSPVLALVSGSVFFAKAGILSGQFYWQAIALFCIAPLMAVYPHYGVSIFGLVAAAAFFIPGLKYYRQRARADQAR